MILFLEPFTAFPFFFPLMTGPKESWNGIWTCGKSSSDFWPEHFYIPSDWFISIWTSFHVFFLYFRSSLDTLRTSFLMINTCLVRIDFLNWILSSGLGEAYRSFAPRSGEEDQLKEELHFDASSSVVSSKAPKRYSKASEERNLVSHSFSGQREPHASIATVSFSLPSLGSSGSIPFRWCSHCKFLNWSFIFQ